MFDLKTMGLTVSQMRCPEDVAHNGGWYDQTGRKIGWGDLSRRDLPNIMSSLKDGEVFFVLGEYDSFWECSRRGVDEHNPGLEYVLNYARYAVTNMGTEYLVADDQVKRTQERHGTHLDGFALIRGRGEFRRLYFPKGRR